METARTHGLTGVYAELRVGIGARQGFVTAPNYALTGEHLVYMQLLVHAVSGVSTVLPVVSPKKRHYLIT